MSAELETSSSGDEFEIIQDDENLRDYVPIQPISIYPSPNEYNSDISIMKVPESIRSEINSIRETPLLSESIRTIDATSTPLNTPKDSQTINEVDNSDMSILNHSVAGSDMSVIMELEEARKAELTIRSFVGKFEELSHALEAQKARILELEHEKMMRVENESLVKNSEEESQLNEKQKLIEDNKMAYEAELAKKEEAIKSVKMECEAAKETASTWQKKLEQLEKDNKMMYEVEMAKRDDTIKALKKECETAKMTTFSCQKKYSQMSQEYENTRIRDQREIEMSRAMEKDLKKQLAAANQCIELWKQNAEKNSTASYGDQKTVIDRLMEENKNLRSSLDEEIARRLEQTELCKLYERQVNAMGGGKQVDSNETQRNMSYYVELEMEIGKLRSELKESRETIQKLKDETNNCTEIVNILREDQTESTRELADRQHKINHLERICQRLGIVHDEL